MPLTWTVRGNFSQMASKSEATSTCLHMRMASGRTNLVIKHPTTCEGWYVGGQAYWLACGGGREQVFTPAGVQNQEVRS